MTDQQLAPQGAFLKRYLSATAADTAWRRSLAAQGVGVPTPAVLGQTGPLALCFNRVDAHGQPTLAEMIGVLRQPHRMPKDGLGRFDPFLRIRPRLGGAPAAVRVAIDGLIAQGAVLNWPETAAIHGDFHPGQSIRDGLGKVWLVDLDDMALAPPEADLGNLAAWLATQKPGDLGALKQSALEQVLAHSLDADAPLTGHFCQIALIRRSLKLAEKGHPWVIDQLPLLT